MLSAHFLLKLVIMKPKPLLGLWASVVKVPSINSFHQPPQPGHMCTRNWIIVFSPSGVPGRRTEMAMRHHPSPGSGQHAQHFLAPRLFQGCWAQGVSSFSHDCAEVISRQRQSRSVGRQPDSQICVTLGVDSASLSPHFLQCLPLRGLMKLQAEALDCGSRAPAW